MLKSLRARRRHDRLMRAADSLISCQTSDELTADDLVALAFGRHQYRITETDAVDYLNAALVRRNRTLRLTAPTA